MANLNAYVDLHCERLQDGLFEEPLNVLSNLLFFIVSYFLLNAYKRADIRAPRIKVLIYVVIAFGFGSIIFHSTARMWGAIFDVFPIAMYAMLYVYVLGRHVLRLSRTKTVQLIGIFALANIVFKANVIKAPDGYVSLIPSLLVMYCICLYMFARRNRSAMRFSAATLVATLAATFRAIDSYMNSEGLCNLFPYGTHFLWHSLMAGFIYIGMSDVILRCKAARVEMRQAHLARLKKIARKRIARRKRKAAKSVVSIIADF